MSDTRQSNRKVLVLAGDGIGPEIMRETMRVMEFFDKRRIASFEVTEGLVGGSAYDASGTPLRHPQVGELFAIGEDGSYRPLFLQQPH